MTPALASLGANLGLSSCTAANKKLPKGHFLDWLDRQDSNLRMLGPKPSALPLGDGPISKDIITKINLCRISAPIKSPSVRGAANNYGEGKLRSADIEI